MFLNLLTFNMAQQLATTIDKQPVLPAAGVISSEQRTLEHNLQGHLRKVYRSQFPYDDVFDFDVMAKMPWIHTVLAKADFDNWFFACTPFNMATRGVLTNTAAVPWQIVQILGNYWYSARKLVMMVKIVCHPTHEYRLQVQWLPSVYFPNLADAQVVYPEFGTLNFRGQRWEINIKQQQNYQFDLEGTMAYLRRRTTQRIAPWPIAEDSGFVYRSASDKNQDLSPCFGIVAIVPVNTFQTSNIAPNNFGAIISFCFDGLETSEPRGVIGSLLISDV